MGIVCGINWPEFERVLSITWLISDHCCANQISQQTHTIIILYRGGVMYGFT